MQHTGEIDSSGIKGGAQSTQLNITGPCVAEQRKQTGKHMSGRWMRAASGAATRALCDGEVRTAPKWRSSDTYTLSSSGASAHPVKKSVSHYVRLCPGITGMRYGNHTNEKSSFIRCNVSLKVKLKNCPLVVGCSK